MIGTVIYDTLLKTLFLGKLRNCYMVVAGFKSSGIVRNVRYLPPLRRYFKTNTTLQLSKVSETYVELDAERIPKDSGHEVDKMSTTPEERIFSTLSEYPNRIKLSVDQIKSFLCHVSDLGFSVDDSAMMVSKCVSILERSKPQLLETVLSLRQCKFCDEDITHILLSSPEYFLMNPTVIVARYSSLREYFSQKLLKHVFSNCPGIFLMKWNVVQGKMDYLINDMSVPKHQIALSNALNCRLEKIRVRHLFLERAGLFKIPNPKVKIPSKNPALTLITDTNDDYFAVNIAGLTAEEYFVFEEMLPLEDGEKYDEEDDEID